MKRREQDLTDTQLPLVPDAPALYRAVADRIRRLVVEAMAASGISQDQICALTGIDAGQLSRMLAPNSGVTLSPRVLGAVLALDRARVLIRGLAAMSGGDFVEKPEMPPEEKVRRLEAKVRKAFGSAGEPFIEEAYAD